MTDTPTDEQVERVARAIAYVGRSALDASEDATDFWAHTTEGRKRRFRIEARAAISAMPAVGVKPLEWRDVAGGWGCDDFYLMPTSCGKYRLYGISGPFDGAAEYDGKSAAKAAAQAVHETRILSALHPLPSPTVGEWQPIETAPKDGSHVFVWLPSAVNHGTFESRIKKAEFVIELDEWRVEGVGGNVPPEPTHWMPLPEPPQTPQEGGE